jgi:hypothetical protein
MISEAMLVDYQNYIIISIMSIDIVCPTSPTTYDTRQISAVHTH